MDDVDHQALHEYVLRRMTEPRFRDLLSVRADDGTIHVVTALREDSMARVIDELQVRGGAGNLVVPFKKGHVVIGMKAIRGRAASKAKPEALTAHCTVSVFLERLRMDGPSVYTFVHDNRNAVGQAELVGVAE